MPLLYTFPAAPSVTNSLPPNVAKAPIFVPTASLPLATFMVEMSIHSRPAVVEYITLKPAAEAGPSWPSPGSGKAVLDTARPLAASCTPMKAVTPAESVLNFVSARLFRPPSMLVKTPVWAGGVRSRTKLKVDDHGLWVPRTGSWTATRQ